MSIKRPVATTPENLRAIAEELARCSAEIAALAAGIQGASFDQVGIPNFGQLQQTVTFSNKYVAAGRNALWEARRDRGDFGDIKNGHAVSGKRVRRPKKKDLRTKTVSDFPNGDAA
jgi:hypothetical protein